MPLVIVNGDFTAYFSENCRPLLDEAYAFSGLLACVIIDLGILYAPRFEKLWLAISRWFTSGVIVD
jgi:hypothetical protein